MAPKPLLPAAVSLAAVLLLAGCSVDLSSPDTSATPTAHPVSSPDLVVPSPSPVRPPVSPPQGNPPPD